MKKDFLKWLTAKQVLHYEKIRTNFHERDVWFSAIGTNIGVEQDGKGTEFLRPVVILRKFNKETLWCIPLSAKEKSGPYYFKFQHKENRSSTANLSQLRLIDSKRLKYPAGYISEEDFTELKKRIIHIVLNDALFHNNPFRGGPKP